LELHRGSWYLRSEELTTCFGLQKSQYGHSYYLNVGFNFRGIDDEPHPLPERCHLRLRIERLVGDDKEIPVVRRLLDIDDPMPDPDRESQLVELLNRWLAPVLERADSVSGLRGLAQDGTIPDHMLTVTARDVLGIPMSEGS